jgi:hypothetical protein
VRARRILGEGPAVRIRLPPAGSLVPAVSRNTCPPWPQGQRPGFRRECEPDRDQDDIRLPVMLDNGMAAAPDNGVPTAGDSTKRYAAKIPDTL